MFRSYLLRCCSFGRVASRANNVKLCLIGAVLCYEFSEFRLRQMDYGTVGVSHPRIIISHSVSTHVIHEVEPDECEGATVCSTPTRYRRLDNGLLKSFARLVIIIPLKLLSRICFSVFSICLFLGIVLYCTLKSQGILAKFATVLISTSIYAMFASRLATMTIRTSKYYLERSKHSDADNLDVIERREN